MTVLKAGSLAYYDSHTSGLVPCKVVSIDRYSDSNTRVLLRVTAERGHGYYVRGKVIDASLSWVMPRNIRRVRGSYGQRVIVPPFTVEITRGC